VLYARIPIGHRVELHLGTGARLEQAHGPRTREIAGELAMHFTEGRDFARAVRYHHQAAGHALNHHGYREAADHLTRALDLLGAVPNTPTRREQGAALHVMRGAALLALHGHADRDVEESYARARALCDDVEDSPRILSVLRALGRFYLVRGSLDAARDVGQRLRGIAESTGDRTARLAAHDTLGHVSFYGGELETAVAHLERVIELSDPTLASRRGSSPLRLILDSGVSSSAHSAWALWMLGYPARAAVRMRETLTLAHALGHPFSLAHARRFAAALHHINRERDAVREQAEASLALSAEHTSGEAASRYFGFSSVHIAADFHRGWWLVDAGRTDEGLAAMRAWVDTCRDTGSECLLPTYLAWLAETYNRIGQLGQGRALVDEALAAAAESGNHYWTAELHRLRSTFADTDTDAESSLREAITIAQRQHAKSFELRAATSLSRLWARQGQATKAHALLADVHAWFTEGFDTADLRDARSLLDELERTTGPRKTPRRRESGP
jgi:predicted ATPase